MASRKGKQSVSGNSIRWVSIQEIAGRVLTRIGRASLMSELGAMRGKGAGIADHQSNEGQIEDTLCPKHRDGADGNERNARISQR